MPERREITRDTLRPLLELKLLKKQEKFVAPNAVTIAQAAYEPGSRVWGLWQGNAAIGLMAMIHPHEGLLEPGEDPDAALLWRLMIGAEHQGKGHGAFAIAEAVSVAREWGLPRLASSVVVAPGSPIFFYEKQGFRQTGTLIDGEMQIIREV